MHARDLMESDVKTVAPDDDVADGLREQVGKGHVPGIRRAGHKSAGSDSRMGRLGPVTSGAADSGRPPTLCHRLTPFRRMGSLKGFIAVREGEAGWLSWT